MVHRHRETAQRSWRRRQVAVIPAPGGGRSRWLGGSRALRALICKAAERIVAGTEPGCTLSRRATERLAGVRERLSFVDGLSLPLVSDDAGHVRLWAFAGALVSAALAHALQVAGFVPLAWDAFSLTIRAADPARLASALARLDPATAYPPLPANLPAALKFSACLPPAIAEAVLRARTDVGNEVAEILARPVRISHH